MSKVTIDCPNCNQFLEGPDEFQGQVVECPACNQSFQLPNPELGQTLPSASKKSQKGHDVSSGKTTKTIATKTDKKQCPQCKSWINKSATKCAHCRSDQPAPAWATIFAIVLVVGFGIWGYQSCTSMFELSPEAQAKLEEERKREERYGSKRMSYVMSQKFVKKLLKSPRSAKFSGYDESFVSDLGSGRYRIDAYVDAQNSFGVMLRMRYTCTLRYTGNDMWTCETANLLE